MASELFVRHPYPVRVWFCTSKKDVDKVLKKEGATKKDIAMVREASKGSHGITTEDYDLGFLVVCVNNKSLSVAVHEIHHAICSLSEYFLLPNNYDGSEPNAYLASAMFEDFRKLLVDDFKIKRKRKPK